MIWVGRGGRGGERAHPVGGRPAEAPGERGPGRRRAWRGLCRVFADPKLLNEVSPAISDVPRAVDSRSCVGRPRCCCGGEYLCSAAPPPTTLPPARLAFLAPPHLLRLAHLRRCRRGRRRDGCVHSAGSGTTRRKRGAARPVLGGPPARLVARRRPDLPPGVHAGPLRRHDAARAAALAAARGRNRPAADGADGRPLDRARRERQPRRARRAVRAARLRPRVDVRGCGERALPSVWPPRGRA